MEAGRAAAMAGLEYAAGDGANSSILSGNQSFASLTASTFSEYPMGGDRNASLVASRVRIWRFFPSYLPGEECSNLEVFCVCDFVACSLCRVDNQQGKKDQQLSPHMDMLAYQKQMSALQAPPPPTSNTVLGELIFSRIEI